GVPSLLWRGPSAGAALSALFEPFISVRPAPTGFYRVSAREVSLGRVRFHGDSIARMAVVDAAPCEARPFLLRLGESPERAEPLLAAVTGDLVELCVAVDTTHYPIASAGRLRRFIHAG